MDEEIRLYSHGAFTHVFLYNPKLLPWSLRNFVISLFILQQLSIKEFYLKIIPYRLHSFRISPSTKVYHIGIAIRSFIKPRPPDNVLNSVIPPPPLKWLHRFFVLKVTFLDTEDHEMFVLDDGIQPPITFTSTKRSLVVATFARFLLRNIGMLVLIFLGGGRGWSPKISTSYCT